MVQIPASATEHVSLPVNSWDEFTTLREIIVGDATHARLPAQSDPSAWLACYPKMNRAELATVEAGQFPRQVIEESNEDLAELAGTLTSLGVKVHQPPAVDHSKEFTSPDWHSGGYISYCPRDITLVIGNTIIETASPMRARYFELFGMRPLFQQYLRDGAHWIAAPRPQLADELYGLDSAGLPTLGEAEPVFDAANVIRLGADLFYQVSRSGNELGLRWLESTLQLIGDIKVHPLRGVYGYTHIDSTITLLRPGLVLLNPERIKPDAVPAAFHGWDVLWCPPLERHPTTLPYTLSEHWISMNLLMVNPELAIADAEQPALVKALEARGISVLPHRLRHQQVLGGGFHCVTLDIKRDGGMEHYLG
jgi:glycine amidinotransferase